MVFGNPGKWQTGAGAGFSYLLCGTLAHMDKVDHGLRLKAAIAARGSNRQEVADYAGVDKRTVTNWTSGKTMPSDTERATLRRLFPGYDDPGDAVEVAIRHSELSEWRQDTVVGFYKRHLSEQQEGRRA